jgi:hypothetical protein
VTLGPGLIRYFDDKLQYSNDGGLTWGDLGGVKDHTLLTNIGTNTHSQLDTHVADTTKHFTQAEIDHTAILNRGTNTHSQLDTHLDDTTKHFTQAEIDHVNILNRGTNTHSQLDTHLADTTKHFTQAEIDHTAILNRGTNTHSQLDTHVANTSIHTTALPAGIIFDWTGTNPPDEFQWYDDKFDGNVLTNPYFYPTLTTGWSSLYGTLTGISDGPGTGLKQYGCRLTRSSGNYQNVFQDMTAVVWGRYYRVGVYLRPSTSNDSTTIGLYQSGGWTTPLVWKALNTLTSGVWTWAELDTFYQPSTGVRFFIQRGMNTAGYIDISVPLLGLIPVARKIIKT